MKKHIASPFHQLVVDRFGYFEAKYLYQQMGLPSHPITRAYNTPEKTPHKVLIAFCLILDMHAHELISGYQVGAARISAIEKAYHQRQFEILEKNS